MKPKVLVATPVSEKVKDYLGEECDVHVWEGEHPISREAFLDFLRKHPDARGIMIKYLQVDKTMLELLPQLEVISNVSVGYDNFDISLMKGHGIIGTHTPSVLDETTADTTFALMLAAARRVVELDRYVKQGQWVDGPENRFYGYDVHSTTLGIIGMGRIGAAVARRGKLGFGMNVVYCNRSPRPEIEKELGARYLALPELLETSDFVVLLTPLTAETRHLMGEKEFKRMKKTAVFVNTSRGPTVDEAALAQALEQGEIFAAGLDVFEQEPVDKNNPLLSLKNVVTLPHIGSATAKTHAAMAELAAKNMRYACTGKQPPNVVKEFIS